MFLYLYELYAANVPASRLRQFYTQSQDWAALRALDAAGLQDTDKGGG